MQQHQNCQKTSTSTISKKKNYSTPTLTVLGKVSELTAGGSNGKKENVAGVDPDPSFYSKQPRS